MVDSRRQQGQGKVSRRSGLREAESGHGASEAVAKSAAASSSCFPFLAGVSYIVMSRSLRGSSRCVGLVPNPSFPCSTIAFYVTVAVFSFLKTYVLALFLGENCRHQQYIGRVKHAVFQTQGSGRKRVVVATEQNALASLNLRTGEICK
jgi:hypothetical protein